MPLKYEGFPYIIERKFTDIKWILLASLESQDNNMLHKASSHCLAEPRKF